MAVRMMFGAAAGFIGGGVLSNMGTNNAPHSSSTSSNRSSSSSSSWAGGEASDSQEAGSSSFSFMNTVSCLNNTIVKSVQSPMGDKSTPRETRIFSNMLKEYTLAEIIPMAHDTALFRFLLPDSEDVFNLKPCSTLQAQYELGANRVEQIMRYYTPVTPNGTKGYFDIIVKRKENGKMTEHIFGLQAGDKLRFKSQTFKIRYTANRWEEIGIVSGGTGFTPMLQVIRAAFDEQLLDQRGRADVTKIKMLQCNRTERHILLKGLFDDYARRFPDRFQIRYCIDAWSDQASEEEKKKWKGYMGYANREMIIESLPRPNADLNKIMVCGPDGLLTHVAGCNPSVMKELSGGKNMQPMSTDRNNMMPLGGVLRDLGWEGHQVYRF